MARPLQFRTPSEIYSLMIRFWLSLSLVNFLFFTPLNWYHWFMRSLQDTGQFAEISMVKDKYILLLYIITALLIIDFPFPLSYYKVQSFNWIQFHHVFGFWEMKEIIWYIILSCYQRLLFLLTIKIGQYLSHKWELYLYVK